VNTNTPNQPDRPITVTLPGWVWGKPAKVVGILALCAWCVFAGYHAGWARGANVMRTPPTYELRDTLRVAGLTIARRCTLAWTPDGRLTAHTGYERVEVSTP